MHKSEYKLCAIRIMAKDEKSEWQREEKTKVTTHDGSFILLSTSPISSVGLMLPDYPKTTIRKTHGRKLPND